jgi:2-oxoglutarate ferredoxin oxidoreductase subunit beta
VQDAPQNLMIFIQITYIHGVLTVEIMESMQQQDTLLCFDIGCNGNGSDKIGGYRFHGLHGRVLPFAAGAAISNSRVSVIAFGGDGGTLGEGINHLINAVRNNYNFTFILHNNMNYGLTQGQSSATTRGETKTNSSPDGTQLEPIHVLHFVLGLKPSFVARTFSGDIKHMQKVIKQGIQHKGFSFIEILQSCPTYNKETPHEWYQQRVFDIDTLDGFDNTDLESAVKISEDLLENIATGVIYENKSKPTFNDIQLNRVGLLTELVDEVRNYSTESLFTEFI